MDNENPGNTDNIVLTLTHDKAKLQTELTRLSQLNSKTIDDRHNIMSLIKGIKTIDDDLLAIKLKRPRPEHFFDYKIMIKEIDAQSGIQPSVNLSEQPKDNLGEHDQKNLVKPNNNDELNQLRADEVKLKKELTRLLESGPTIGDYSNILSLKLAIKNINLDLTALSNNQPKTDHFFDYQIMINEINQRTEQEDLESSSLSAKSTTAQKSDTDESSSNNTEQNTDESISNTSDEIKKKMLLLNRSHPHSQA